MPRAGAGGTRSMSAGAAAAAGADGRRSADAGARLPDERSAGSPDDESAAAQPDGAVMQDSGTAATTGAGAAGGEAVDAGAGISDAGPAGATDSDCDLSGIWLAKQITISEALSLPQSSNNWYFLELRQIGDVVEVVRHFDCGIEIRGSLTVVVTRATLASLITQNVQTGRKGTMTKQGATCNFAMSRFWSIRGADTQRFLPVDGRASVQSSDEVAADRPLPSANQPEGAVDTEGDGKLGVAFEVAGLGVRNSVQRDWTEWFTEPGFEITPSSDWTDLTVRADFDNEEAVIDPPSGLLMSTSMPTTAAKHVLKLRFLGRDMSDPRAQAIVRDDDVETCFGVQDAMPAEQLE